MEEKDLLWIEEWIRERALFEHVIFLRTSAGVAANCGEGSFGLQYLIKGEKDYSLGTFFDEDLSSAKETSSDTDTLADQNLSKAKESFEGAKDAPDVPVNLKEEDIFDIDGITIEDGLKYCGSMDAFRKFLNTFCDTIDSKSDEIEDAYRRKDISFYTIKVHALKSTSRIIGARELSKLAESLEMAGKDGNQAYIDENTGKLLELFRSYKTIAH